jgi:hypothetical protein
MATLASEIRSYDSIDEIEPYGVMSDRLFSVARKQLSDVQRAVTSGGAQVLNAFVDYVRGFAGSE